MVMVSVVAIMLLWSLFLDCVISSLRWHVMLLTHHPSYRSYFMSTVTYVALYQAASVGSFGSIVIDTPSGWYYFMGIFLHILLLILWEKNLRQKNHLEPFRFTPTTPHFWSVSAFC